MRKILKMVNRILLLFSNNEQKYRHIENLFDFADSCGYSSEILNSVKCYLELKNNALIENAC